MADKPKDEQEMPVVGDRYGILVPPEDLKLPHAATKEPFSLSSLQANFSAAFYSRDSDPLNLFNTLGNVDVLLPQACAVDYVNTGNLAVHKSQKHSLE